MKLQINADSTDVSLVIFINDITSAIGAGLEGVLFNAAGLTCYYLRPGAAAAQLALANVAVAGAHADGGFIEISAANMPGWYRLDLSDAIVAAGVTSAGVYLGEAADMAPLLIEIQLDAAAAVVRTPRHPAYIYQVPAIV